MSYGLYLETSYGKKVIDTEALPFRISRSGTSTTQSVYLSSPNGGAYVTGNLIPIPALGESLAINVVGDRTVYIAALTYPGNTSNPTHYVVSVSENISTTINWIIFDRSPQLIGTHGLQTFDANGNLLFDLSNRHYAIKSRGIMTSYFYDKYAVSLSYGTGYYITTPLIDATTVMLTSPLHMGYPSLFYVRITTSGSIASIVVDEFWEDHWSYAPTEITIAGMSGKIV